VDSLFKKLTSGQWIQDIILGISFLTRLPISHSLPYKRFIMQSAWSFPLVGSFLGFLGGSVSWVLLELQLPLLIISFLTIGTLILLTGGLHEDGLADMADGFGGGSNPENKIAIMRDSQIGTYGTLILILVIAIKAAGIVTLLGQDNTLNCMVALVVSGSISRSLMVCVAYTLDHASEKGIGKFAGKPDSHTAISSIFITVITSIFLLPIMKAMIVLTLATLTATAIGLLAKRQINGYTGDILGATQQLSEVIVLIFLATAVT
jgi:adenosylcobinamide-GDP ribazoletransferase